MALNYFLKGLKLLDSILHHSLLKVLFHKKRKKKVIVYVWGAFT